MAIHLKKGTITSREIAREFKESFPLLVFPSNINDHHPDEVTPYSHKSGGGLAAVAGKCSKLGIATLGLPTCEKSGGDGNPVNRQQAEKAIEDIRKAMEYGYEIILPVREPMGGYFSKFFTLNGQRCEPSLWGNINKTPNREVADYYVEALQKLIDNPPAVNSKPLATREGNFGSSEAQIDPWNRCYHVFTQLKRKNRQKEAKEDARESRYSRFLLGSMSGSLGLVVCFAIFSMWPLMIISAVVFMAASVQLLNRIGEDFMNGPTFNPLPYDYDDIVALIELDKQAEYKDITKLGNQFDIYSTNERNGPHR